METTLTLPRIVSQEEGLIAFPDGAADLVACRHCGTLMLTKPGAEPDCGCKAV